ncbi:expressed protein [Arabidopsis lyrata subsp. lyrata]|uniref:Expressed protein n=1 Tax=Arabidopsis lyrata subsp. lyrata TaxID=81972 RepID=D7LLB3_ARALL|nr:expressed protein [Arabidopsis lyrata subsp. lyrata]
MVLRSFKKGTNLLNRHGPMQPKAKGFADVSTFSDILTSVDQDSKIRYVRRRTSFHE